MLVTVKVTRYELATVNTPGDIVFVRALSFVAAIVATPPAIVQREPVVQSPTVAKSPFTRMFVDGMCRMISC